MTGTRPTPALAPSALALACLVGACAPDSRDMDHVQIAVTPHLTIAPVFIAHAEGFFEELGIDAELVRTDVAATAIPPLLQGRLDVLPGPLSPSFFNVITRGGRVRFVADKGMFSAQACSHQALVVSRKTIEEGEPVTLRRVGTAKEPFLQFFVERALSARGYDPDSIELVHVPPAAEYDGVVAGRLDGAMMGEPWLTRLRKTGGGVEWTPTNTFLDGYHYSVFVYGPRLLDEDPELGQRVAVALLNGVRRYNEGKTERNVQILVDALGHDPDELRDSCWPHMRDDGLIRPEGIMAFQEWAFERGDLDAVVGVEDFWDPRFVEHALSVLGAGS